VLTRGKVEKSGPPVVYRSKAEMTAAVEFFGRALKGKTRDERASDVWNTTFEANGGRVRTGE
jgi:hypothetical protein